MLRGGNEDDDGGVDDVRTALAFELEGGGDADGRDEELIAVDDELYKELAEGLRGGEEETGDKRKLRMGRGSTGLDLEGSS